MRRWLPTGLSALTAVALAAVGYAESEEPKKPDAPAKADPKSDAKPGGELAKLKAKFDADVKEKEAEMKKARTADEFDDLKKELREFKAIELDGLFDAAAAEPETAAAFDVFSELLFGGFDEKKSKLSRTFIEKNHLDKPHVKKVLLPLVLKGDSRADVLLRTVVEKNPDRDCQGTATYALGLFAKAKVKQAGGEAKAEEAKRAKAYLARAREKFGDVKVGDQTVAKLAEGEIEAINLIGQLEVGKPVPEVAGEDLDGKAMKLSETKGKVVLLSFWATWCPPCMRLVPHERELFDRLKDKPFALVGINGDPELTDDVKDTIKDKKIAWRSFKNEQKDKPAISATWEIEGWPTIYLIDHKGVIRQKWTGSPGEKVMDEEIDKLVEAAEKEKKK